MGLLTLIFSLTGLAYAASCGLFFVHLTRGKESAVRGGTRLLAAAIATHAAYLAGDFLLENRDPTADIYQVLVLLSLLISVAFLLSMRRARLSVLGAFITPIALVLFLSAGLRGSVPPVPEGVRSALLPVHIAVNVLGIVAFALAFATAVAYVIQEKLLRSKQVVGTFQRLPSLDVLDSFGLKLVTIGFPLFTLGMVSGSFWAVKLGGDPTHLTTGQGFAVLAWVFFAGVLLSRAAAGWRGRRAAIGTMLGFLCSLAALGGYLLRSAGGS
ncbi:MAG: cytochrome c biogenesis protein [Myxococcales bacterium]|nr:cytochrome c biogenesis protein [Myxococcales bacterium]